MDVVKIEIIGICPICDRAMWKDAYVDKHHFFPKMYGGKKTEWVHKVCHRKIHSVFTEKELAKEYFDPNRLKQHPEMIKFIEWISSKSPDFYTKNDTHRRKRRK